MKDVVLIVLPESWLERVRFEIQKASRHRLRR